VYRLVSKEASFFSASCYSGIIVELRRDVEVLIPINEDLVRPFKQQAKHIGLLKGHCEVESHLVLGTKVVNNKIEK
jgi:hypothetical protein